MAATVWLGPLCHGSVFNVDDKPFTVVGITPAGSFFGDTLRTTPPDFFLPLTTEPYVEVDADLNKYDTHWLKLDRPHPARRGARIYSLKCAWNSSNGYTLTGGEMSADDRVRVPRTRLCS